MNDAAQEIVAGARTAREQSAGREQGPGREQSAGRERSPDGVAAGRAALYTGYPALERIAFDRRHQELKPAWLLRYWYLGQHLAQPNGSGMVRRSDLFEVWDLLGQRRSTFRRLLTAGDGVLWEKEGETGVRFYSAERLHRELGLPVVERRRPYDQLLIRTADWHRELVLEEVRYARTAGTKVGLPFSAETLRRHTSDAAPDH